MSWLSHPGNLIVPTEILGKTVLGENKVWCSGDAAGPVWSLVSDGATGGVWEPPAMASAGVSHGWFFRVMHLGTELVWV